MTSSTNFEEVLAYVMVPTLLFYIIFQIVVKFSGLYRVKTFDSVKKKYTLSTLRPAELLTKIKSLEIDPSENDSPMRKKSTFFNKIGSKISSNWKFAAHREEDNDTKDPPLKLKSFKQIYSEHQSCEIVTQSEPSLIDYDSLPHMEGGFGKKKSAQYELNHNVTVNAEPIYAKVNKPSRKTIPAHPSRPHMKPQLQMSEPVSQELSDCHSITKGQTCSQGNVNLALKGDDTLPIGVKAPKLVKHDETKFSEIWICPSLLKSDRVLAKQTTESLNTSLDSNSPVPRLSDSAKRGKTSDPQTPPGQPPQRPSPSDVRFSRQSTQHPVWPASAKLSQLGPEPPTTNLQLVKNPLGKYENQPKTAPDVLTWSDDNTGRTKQMKQKSKSVRVREEHEPEKRRERTTPTHIASLKPVGAITIENSANTARALCAEKITPTAFIKPNKRVTFAPTRQNPEPGQFSMTENEFLSSIDQYYDRTAGLKENHFCQLCEDDVFHTHAKPPNAGSIKL